MSTEMRWNKPIPQIAKEATGGNKTLLFMAQEARRLMDPYVPARNMVLSRNVRTYVEDDHGVVHYMTPYARFQYEGFVMVSRITGSPWANRGESKSLIKNTNAEQAHRFNREQGDMFDEPPPYDDLPY